MNCSIHINVNLLHQGGPYGIMLRVNGKVVPASKMRCKPVRGTLAQFNAANPNWQKASYNVNAWAQAVVINF